MTTKLTLWLARVASAAALMATTLVANAQFTPGQILTASQLNSAFAAKTTNAAAAITGGTITGLSSPLPVASGGTGATTLVGLIAPSYIAAQAADTVLANATSSSASPTAFAMPSCSSSSSALQYTSGTGFTCYTSTATTTGTLAQFAATTSSQLAGVLSDETGSGAAVFGTNPAISGATITGSSYAGSVAATTLAASSTVSGTGFSTYLASPPCIGCTTANSGAFTTLSTSSGLTGITSGTNGSAGTVGQCVTSSVASGSGVSLTSGTPANVTSISLTAGDWLVFGAVDFNIGGTTTITYIAGSANTTSAALNSGNFFLVSAPGGSSATVAGAAIPTIRLNLSSTTTVFLTTTSLFSSSTLAAFGNITGCRWH